jgi:hypothetical protein
MDGELPAALFATEGMWLIGAPPMTGQVDVDASRVCWVGSEDDKFVPAFTT